MRITASVPPRPEPEALVPVHTHVLRFCRRFRASTHGVVAVEYAFVALPFLAMVFAIAETGFDYFCLSSLDAMTQKAARQIQIGTVQQQGLDTTGFRTLVCGMLPSMMACSNLSFNVQTVSTSYYAVTSSQVAGNGLTQYSLKQPSLDQTQNRFCPGVSNQYVVVQFVYAIPVLTGIWATSSVQFGGKSVRVINTTNVFRNENFSGSGPC